ncbi:MAG: ATP-binding protein [Puia sp.]|nr:ATP-binding protein [Puia sp.]
MLPSKKPTRILIVEDDEDDFLIISGCLKDIPDSNFLIDWCYNYDESLRRMFGEGYDIYFVDYLLGEKTGLDFLGDAIASGCEDPIVLLTGIDSREIDIKAMTTGAVDYLIKSEINTEKLERCIRYSLERSAALKAIKANERKFYSIFEKSKDAFFLTDEDLVFRDVNSATSDFFKYSKTELLQLSLYGLLARQELVPLLEEQLARTGEVDDQEVEFLTRTKERKTCILSLSQQFKADGELYIQGIIHDITNLKRIERATLQIEKLRSTALLLRTLAHEVRNPLTNINLSVEQLKPEIGDGLAGDAGIYLDIIIRNCNRIDALISELLDLARPGDILLKRASLQEIMDKSLAAASDRLALNGIRVELSYPEEGSYIMADVEKLKIAFLNIIINAIEAMPRESGRLAVSISREESFYKLLIRDNGSGIPEENLSRIFEPYFTSKKNGFGLGLAATWNIIRSHKGSIDVYSHADEGTSFIILFDKAPVEEDIRQSLAGIGPVPDGSETEDATC